MKLLLQPLAWEALKRSLESGIVRIESLATALGFTSTTTLEPAPIPLDVKVVLFGDRRLYHLLSQFDRDVARHFKVVADFDEELKRTSGNHELFAHLVATTARNKDLLSFENTAVAELANEAARASGDGQKLSASLVALEDLCCEAEHFCRLNGRQHVSADDVKRAIMSRVARFDRITQKVQESIERDVLLIATSGEAIGQVNGLSVYQFADFAFGKPSRITARVRLGKGDVVDIEREVKLGGPIHSKGVPILSGYLGSQYAMEFPLSLAATLVFEQSYGGVEGDSASAAELFALLSALSGVPIRQSFAVTGSVNQNGNIQAIGSVNEKVEGFFDVCCARGLTGQQGVIVPRSNVDHLMLRDRVLEAAQSNKFHIYAIDTIDEGIEILTGVEAGVRDASGAFPPHSINDKAQNRLMEFAEQRRKFAQNGRETT